MTDRIKSVESLQNLVNLDKEEHKLKDITQLFLNAMVDWTTFNQTDISEFITELKHYFGSPLTIAKIRRKQLDMNREHDAWRHEAGSSIEELISISDKFYNEPNFDQIIKNIFEYYGNRKFIL